ncbi:metallophosphoesterase [Streptomyces chattanoogensis]|uniref:Membrane protein n=1 Tax=Streptomyces chattanoogensis TaxID=66876 RepID=A0A0N0XQR9_9ACTN|nr:metallophosphoesterase [Streptomyces chattanoogensis]KPC59336.1 membrane protein [Streptomyces chattanoogensis]
MIFALIVVAVLGLFFAVHRYLWCRLIRDTTRAGGRVRRTGAVAAFVLPVLVLAALLAERLGAPFVLQQVLAWPGYLWLALVLYLVLALLVGEVVRVVWLRVIPARTASPAPLPLPAPASPPAQSPSPAPSPLPAPSRRVFVARAVASGATLASAATVGYGTATALRGPRLKRVTVPLAKLPRAAHGFRIALVSDVHLSPVLGRTHTRRVVETVNRTGADLVAIVGDLVDGSVPDLGPAAEPLRALESRYGSYFVTGNHEYYSGAAQWVDYVEELGITPLENARIELPGFDLAGINDLAGEREHAGPDYARALGGRDTARAVVLLAHQPVTVHDSARYGVDLQLSGHTHGGQMWPVTYLAAATNPTVAGLAHYGGTQLYVTRGAGAWGPPVRVGAPPDVTVVELASMRA